MHFMIVVPIKVREVFVITKSRYLAFIDKTNIMADYGRLILGHIHALYHTLTQNQKQETT